MASFGTVQHDTLCPANFEVRVGVALVLDITRGILPLFSHAACSLSPSSRIASHDFTSTFGACLLGDPCSRCRREEFAAAGPGVDAVDLWSGKLDLWGGRHGNCCARLRARIDGAILDGFCRVCAKQASYGVRPKV